MSEEKRVHQTINRIMFALFTEGVCLFVCVLRTLMKWLNYRRIRTCFDSFRLLFFLNTISLDSRIIISGIMAGRLGIVYRLVLKVGDN